MFGSGTGAMKPGGGGGDASLATKMALRRVEDHVNGRIDCLDELVTDKVSHFQNRLDGQRSYIERTLQTKASVGETQRQIQAITNTAEVHAE